jgi:hypothetical protein
VSKRILSVERKELAIISSLKGAGVSTTYALWGDFTASEFFPLVEDSAFYILCVESPVSNISDVRPVERQLNRIMGFLAAAWPFAGGSFMRTEERGTRELISGESNADAIESEILADSNSKQVSASFRATAEVVATYARPPLQTAITIVQAMNSDTALAQLLTYHQLAWMDKQFRGNTWFVDLYKVRDVLSDVYGGKVKATSALKISKAAWRNFGRALNNNDLRHAQVTRVGGLSDTEAIALFTTGFHWVDQHLRNLKLIP